MLRKALAAAAGTALLAGTATAATTISSTPFGLAAPAGTTILVDFDGGDAGLPAGITLTGSYSYNTGTSSGNQAAPAGDATQYLVVPGTGQVNGSATLKSSTGHKSVSFYWGSIDSYNYVTLLDINGNAIGPEYSGNTPNVADPLANGDQVLGGTNRRVTFTQAAGDPMIYGIQFRNSGSRAFELDNVAFGAVPEPATWAMLIAGFGLVGGAMRRRRHGSTMVTA
jgi:hypothetical protein